MLVKWVLVLWCKNNNLQYQVWSHTTTQIKNWRKCLGHILSWGKHFMWKSFYKAVSNAAVGGWGDFGGSVKWWEGLSETISLLLTESFMIVLSHHYQDAHSVLHVAPLRAETTYHSFSLTCSVHFCWIAPLVCLLKFLQTKFFTLQARSNSSSQSHRNLQQNEMLVSLKIKAKYSRNMLGLYKQFPPESIKFSVSDFNAPFSLLDTLPCDHMVIAFQWGFSTKIRVKRKIFIIYHLSFHYALKKISPTHLEWLHHVNYMACYVNQPRMPKHANFNVTTVHSGRWHSFVIHQIHIPSLDWEMWEMWDERNVIHSNIFPLLQSPVLRCFTPPQTTLCTAHGDLRLVCSYLDMETHFTNFLIFHFY